MANPFVEKLSTGQWSPEQFRSHLEKAGTPLVERVSPDEAEVTFVAECEDDATTVRLSAVIGHAIGRQTIGDPFAAVTGTSLRALTMRMRSDLRFSYAFVRTGEHGAIAETPDPFNPPPRFSEYPEARFSGSSVAMLPDAARLPWLARAEAAPTPVGECGLLVSEILGNERRVWVSMPPGDVLGETALPFVIQLDGTEDHSAPSVRDALVRAGSIRPCAVVLVDQLGRRRYQELLCDRSFARMLVEELLPWLHGRYPLSRDPADVALAGESYGGLCAGWTALHHPTVFGNAILQSPSCGYHPGAGAASDGFQRRIPVPTLIADYLAADPVPLRIFHDVGELEDSNTHSRWLNEVLLRKGYDTCYREFAGGHDYAWWRGLFADALQWCFPVATEAAHPQRDEKRPSPGGVRERA